MKIIIRNSLDKWALIAISQQHEHTDETYNMCVSTMLASWLYDAIASCACACVWADQPSTTLPACGQQIIDRWVCVYIFTTLVIRLINCWQPGIHQSHRILPCKIGGCFPWILSHGGRYRRIDAHRYRLNIEYDIILFRRIPADFVKLLLAKFEYDFTRTINMSHCSILDNQIFQAEKKFFIRSIFNFEWVIYCSYFRSYAHAQPLYKHTSS